MRRLFPPPCPQAGSLLAGALLLGLGLGPPPSHAQDRPPGPPLQVADSLRAEGRFRAALRRLPTPGEGKAPSVEVLWRRALLWSDYGFSQLTQGNKQAARPALEKGLRWAEKALAAGPKSAWAHLATAIAAGRAARLADGRREKVRLSRQIKRHADRALALDSTLAPAYHVRGVWHMKVASLGALARAVAQVVYGGLPEASLTQAAADLRRALTLEPRASTYLQLAKVYRKMGRPTAARKQLRKALKASSGDPFAPLAKEKARALLRKLREEKRKEENGDERRRPPGRSPPTGEPRASPQ